MKLATLKDRTRDGMLVVVSRDLTRCVSARPIASTLQAALDDWDHVAPRLADLAHDLELGAVPALRFHEHDAMSPLPRAYQRLNATPADGSRRAGARGATFEGMLLQGASDNFVGPRDPISVAATDGNVGVEGAVAVVTGDLPAGSDRDVAAAAIRLLMLANAVSLPNLVHAEDGPEGGSIDAEPMSAFSPVAVTPDELGDAWDGGRVPLPLLISVRGQSAVRATAVLDFRALIMRTARTRRLSAGTILTSAAETQPGEWTGAGQRGPSATGTNEAITASEAGTMHLGVGDTVRIEMKDRSGHSIFGAIEQTVERSGGQDRFPR